MTNQHKTNLPEKLELSGLLDIKYLVHTRKKFKFQKFLFMGETVTTTIELFYTRAAIKSNSKPKSNGFYGGNLGKVLFSIRDITHKYLAYSTGENKPISVNASSFKGSTRKKKESWRCNCTEFQMLNYLDMKFNHHQINQRELTSIKLWTERMPCISCTRVIYKFLKKYNKCIMSIIYRDAEDKNKRYACWHKLGNRIKLYQDKSWPDDFLT